MPHRLFAGLALAALAGATFAPPTDAGSAPQPDPKAAPAGNDLLTGDVGNDLIAATPRDETAWSYDPFTGTTQTSHQDLQRANEAMIELGKTGDEAAFHAALAGEADEATEG